MVASLSKTALAIVATLLCVTQTPVRAQESHVLLGTIRDYETGRPLAGARVAVVGTNIVADTDGVGRYQLFNLAPGPHRLRIDHSGHASLIENITVTSDSITVAHFHLPVRATLWDRLTMSAPAPEPSGTAPAANESGDTVADLLDRHVPGLGISRGSGQVGSGVRFRLRGARSFTGPSAPLVYIDGIRVEYALGGPGIQGLAGPSALDLLEPSMIERIEVLRGPEATTYGLNASNGVILVTTKGRR